MSLQEEFYKGYMIVIDYDECDDAESPREWDNLGTMICWHNNYILGDKNCYKDNTDFLESMLYEVGEAYEGWVGETNAFHPKSFDYATHMTEWRKKYNYDGVWTYQDFERELDEGLGDAQTEALWRIEDHMIILPIYMYEHSGITINTSGFACPWDSGQVGWIYITHEDLKKEFKRKKLSKKLVSQAEDILRQEVDTYDRFLRGEYYKYEIYPCVEEEEDYVWDDDDLVDDGYGFETEEYALSEAMATVDWLLKEKK